MGATAQGPITTLAIIRHTGIAKDPFYTWLDKSKPVFETRGEFKFTSCEAYDHFVAMLAVKRWHLQSMLKKRAVMRKMISMCVENVSKNLQTSRVS